MARDVFDYDQAFVRNLGLVSPQEQSRLRQIRVAIPGMGGVGGLHLLTLTRLGIAQFAIADGDTFDLQNFNRQFGATVDTIGRPKVDVMAAMASSINPQASIRIIPHPIDSENVDQLLDNCTAVVDGLDFFELDARRLVFHRARQRGLPVVTCAPLGFSVALLTFLPNGPSFDEFFAIRDGMDRYDQLARFAVGLAPAAVHLPYLDRSKISLTNRHGPSSIIAVDLCAALAATEILNLVLKRRPPVAVPRYLQFDPYRLRLCTGRLRWGNRHPVQRLKLWWLRHQLRHLIDS